MRALISKPLAALGALALAFACSGEELPARFDDSDAAGGGSAGAGGRGREGGAGFPASYCGNQIIPVILERPNLYFMIDRSGSMGLRQGSYDKFTTARLAISDVLGQIGHRVSYGAAVFPAFRNTDGCAPGDEVFATTAGDPPSGDGERGPTLLKLLRVLSGYEPEGGTPLSGTLARLSPTLLELSGRTAMILATDGAANCNAGASCEAARCMLNIERLVVDGVPCSGSFNCCDPENFEHGPRQCVDDLASVAALQALAQNDIPTYVIGLPGSELYADVLRSYAVAGGTVRAAEPGYYSVTDRAELTATLRGILGEIAISCDVTLDAEPPDAQLVNVYFDERLVAYNEANGWAWTSARSLQLRGARCAELKSGEVVQVQVVSGCRTTVE